MARLPAPPNFFSKVKELRLAGVTLKNIPAILGVTYGQVLVASRALVKSGEVGPELGKNITKQASKKYTNEQKKEVLRLRAAGVSLADISSSTGVGAGSVRAFCGEAGVRLTSEQRGANRRRHSFEVDDQIVKLRLEEGKTRTAIATALTIPVSKVKTVLVRGHHTLPPEVAQANISAGRRPYLEMKEAEVHDHAAKRQGAFVGPYRGSRVPTTWRCSKDHQFDMRPNDVQQGQWCPKCFDRESKIQKDLHAFVQTLVSEEVLLSDRTVLAPKELDVYVPSKKLGIELDGLFWHSSAGPGFRRGASAEKARLARSAGLNFFMIYEDEWRNKRPLVERMIESRLGVSKGRKVDARKLEVRRLATNSEFEVFFESNHLDGQANASYAYGLFEDDALLACASVRRNRRSELELARLATEGSVIVRGAAGRLISAILVDVDEPLYSFSNNRLSSGAVYQALGFEEVTETTAPSYYYTDLKTRIWRYRCRRENDPVVLAAFPGVPHHEEAQALAGVFSEKLFGDRRALYRIEDCGHRKWVRHP